uniref:Sepiapterin reductase n=1 Tax=Chromera velia CCMP2878 TaxID=1169474 RepID=A0A0G4HXN4_9ALVE|eukprot:Cvel_33207.t1-p1 / transcript=Cvel_33207.t1 / gene=Cvel_33207 / organism=Chromera_velia_CCMP2878 / gene_product=Sepiapterin reductase, putative / transcript_product=Sepiapterin reductase, putative / location=Cvel_scaffold5335:489-3589(+) / protein_length=261 / sequence_SO=supercontig / SO=protein_coding / is_pseudo=false
MQMEMLKKELIDAGFRTETENGSGGGLREIRVHRVDLSAPAEVKSSFESALDGALDGMRGGESSASVDGCSSVLFFANSGSLGPLVPVGDLPDSEIFSAVSLNVSSFCVCVSSFLRWIKNTVEQDQKEDGGERTKLRVRVVNTSSLLAVQPFNAFSLYATGKAARDMFVRACAEEMQAEERMDIKFLNWAPGPLSTAMMDEILENCGDAKVRSEFRKMEEGGNILDPSMSAERLLSVLKANSFSSGAHIDFFDVNDKGVPI